MRSLAVLGAKPFVNGTSTAQDSKHGIELGTVQSLHTASTPATHAAACRCDICPARPVLKQVVAGEALDEATRMQRHQVRCQQHAVAIHIICRDKATHMQRHYAVCRVACKQLAWARIHMCGSRILAHASTMSPAAITHVVLCMHSCHALRASRAEHA